MNQQIISYLQQNKDNYSKESLMRELQKARYSEQDIRDGVNYVYNTSTDNSDPNSSIKRRSKLANGLMIAKQSFLVLKKDKEILMFPVISSIVSLLIMATFIIPIILFADTLTQNAVVLYIGIFLFYISTYFVVTFFNSGLITCVNIRLSGGNPTFSDGLKNAFAHISSIFMWALISATVGTVLQIVIGQLERFGTVGRIIGRLIVDTIGFVWGLLTYFVVPVIIIENVRPKEAIKESAELFRKTWGENIMGNFSISIFFVLFALIAIVPFVLAIFTGSLSIVVTTIVLIVLYWIGLGITNASLKGIFVTALYIYAKTGVVPNGFDKDIIVQAFKEKKNKAYL